MKWHEWRSFHQDIAAADPRLARTIDPCDQDQLFSAGLRLHRFGSSGMPEPQRLVLDAKTEIEAAWARARRPYYKLWPGVAQSLLRVPLNLPSASVPPTPCGAILLRFRGGDELAIGGGPRISAVLAGDLTCPGGRGMIIFWSLGDPRLQLAALIPLYQETLEEAVSSLIRDSEREATRGLGQAARLSLGIALLANDPQMIEPDFLEADQDAVAAARLAGDQAALDRLAEKARGRGKNGWIIGRRLEVDPHFRRSHLRLAKVGVGRKDLRIVPVRGCIVHRERVTQVPTGYLDPAAGEEKGAT